MISSSSPSSSRPSRSGPSPLDLPDLLAEIIVALGLAHRHLDLGIDGLFQFGEFNLPVDDLQDLFHPRRRADPLSRISCFSSVFSGRWAQITSTSLEGSSMLLTDFTTSLANLLVGIGKLVEKLAQFPLIGHQFAGLLDRYPAVSSTSTCRKLSLGTKEMILARVLPSTRALIVPSGRRRSCITEARVPVGIHLFLSGLIDRRHPSG